MNLKNNLILLAVVLSLAMFIGFYERKQVGTAQKGQQESLPLWVLPADQIEQIRLKNPSGSYELKKHNGLWQLTQPQRIPAHSGAAQRLMHAVLQLRAQTLVSESVNPEDLKNYGLDEPLLSIDFATAKNKHYVLQLGDALPAAKSYYARIADQAKVFVLGESVYQVLSQNLSQLRDPRLLALQASQLQSVDVQTDDYQLFLEKTGESWLVREQEMRPADRNSVESYLQAISLLSFKEAIDQPEPGDYGFGQPSMRVRCVHQNGQKQELLVGKARINNAQLFYAKRVGFSSLYLTGQEDLQKFTPALRELRSRDLLTLDANKVKMIELYDQKTLRFEASSLGGSAWALKAPKQTTRMGNQSFNVFWAALSSTQIEEYVAPQEVQDKSQVIRVKLHADALEQPLEMAFYVQNEQIFVHKGPDWMRVDNRLLSLIEASYGQLTASAQESRQP